MGNRFFSTEPTEARVPPRAYALLDRLEDDRVYLEGVDAEWFDQVADEGMAPEQWIRRSSSAPIFVLQLSPSQFASFGQTQWRKRLTREGDAAGSHWFEIGLEDMPAGDARIHFTLYEPGRPITVTHVGPLYAPKAGALKRTFDLTPFEAKPAEIDAALVRFRFDRIDWVAVYDVGQGSASALCDRSGIPLAYYDLGGGVLANWATFPTQFRHICTTASPFVILSHWDWDHWSLGSRAPDAVLLTWLVPNQELGAVHAAFAASIADVGKLMVWPKRMRRRKVGQVRIERCLGKSGRNHTGLALVVDGPGGEPPILLSGDARYTAIPSRKLSFTAMVAPHHGADMRGKYTPCPAIAATQARVAYSYGYPNTFSHPRSCTYDRHHVQGWPQSSITPGPGCDRHTAHRPTGGLGHIGLGWQPGRPLPVQPCRGGICSLQLEQD